MKIENVAFDADGVLQDTEFFQLSTEVKKFMKKEFGLDVVNENGYGIKDVFGCSKEIEMKFWEKFIIKYSLRFKTREGMAELIQKLREEGKKVYIITSKACALEKNYKGFAVKTLFELGLQLNNIHVDGIEYCSLENSHLSKYEACKKLNIDIIIEDKAENIQYLSKYIPVLCFRSKNNKDAIFNEMVTHVYSADEIYYNINRLSGVYESNITLFKNRNELKDMNASGKTNYYLEMQKYYQSLPFNKAKMEKAELKIRIISKFIALYFKCKYSPIVVGLENLPAQKGYIYICNHLCDKDLFLLLTFLNTKNSQWHPLAKKELLDEKIGFLFEEADSTFVERENQFSRHCATHTMAKKIENRYNCLIFPEATYNKTGNNIAPFKGASHVYLAQALHRKIVPLAITNCDLEKPILRIGKPLEIGYEENFSDFYETTMTTLDSLVEENNQLLLRLGEKKHARK